jgi:hypothetical protein
VPNKTEKLLNIPSETKYCAHLAAAATAAAAPSASILWGRQTYK